MTLRARGSDWTRRRMLQGTALGAAAIPAAGLLGACATSGDSGEGDGVTNTGDPENPFEVDESAALDVVIFDGGFGTAYADTKTGHGSLYKKKFSGADVKVGAEQDIAGTQQSRFTDGNPPDLLDDSGDGKIALDALVKDELVTDLTPLLDAPSFDNPDKKVKDTLVPGALKQGTFNGKVYALPYAMESWAVWYDAALMKEKGWPVPKTWEEMLELCKDIKKDGIAPWTYAGKHSYYLWDLLFTLACRHGGRDISTKIDNLEPKAWEHDSLKMAAEALYSLQDKGYIMEGTPGINHTESQTKWNNGDAVFLPCGSWLANEQRKDTPEGFEYAAMGVPPFKGSKQPDLVWSAGGEPFVVPSAGKNREGAFEFLRIMLSKKGSKVFAEATKSPSVLADQKIEDQAAKALADLVKSEKNVYRPQIADWYIAFKDQVEPVLGEMMAGDTKPDAFLKKAQKAADSVKKDESIKKFKQSY